MVIAHDWLHSDICYQTRSSPSLVIADKYSCDRNGSLYKASWWMDKVNDCRGPPSFIDYDPIGIADDQYICDEHSQCPYAIVREYVYDHNCSDSASELWMERPYIMGICQEILDEDINDINNIDGNVSNDTFGIMECDEEIGVTLTLYDTEECIGNVTAEIVHTPMNQCVGGHPSRRLMSCHHRLDTTTSTSTMIPSTTEEESTEWAKLDISQRWAIIGITFICTTGFLCCLVVWYGAVICYRARPTKKGYSRALRESEHMG